MVFEMHDFEVGLQVRVASKGASKEQELISWDDVKDQKEVYQAVRTADGRQALVKAGGEPFVLLPDPDLTAFAVSNHSRHALWGSCAIHTIDEEKDEDNGSGCMESIQLTEIVTSADGANQEELLYLEDPPKATPDMSVAQGCHASALYYVPTAAGSGPMYAYPVQYPDGRIMYHILPPQVWPLSASSDAFKLNSTRILLMLTFLEGVLYAMSKLS